MITAVYGLFFLIAMICTTVYIFIWHKHFDINFTMIFTLAPIATMGYYLFSRALTLNEAVAGVQITYLGGCFLQFFIVLSIFDLCKIEIKKWLRTVMFILCAALYGSVLTIGKNKLFYREMTYRNVNGACLLDHTYGPLHTVFCVVAVVFFIAGISAILYSWFKKKQIPRRILVLLIIPDIMCIFFFLVGKRLITNFDTVPISYIAAEFMYLLIALRINLYDISDTVIDSIDNEKALGYISYDFKHRYLGSNDVAKELMPELAEVSVDSPLGNTKDEQLIREYLTSFEENEAEKNHIFTVEAADGDPEKTRYYNATVNYLFDGSKKRGYIITLSDDTANRKYINLLNNYNDTLEKEVERKTKHIVEMHDNLIISLATMIESRDTSTGGHVKRTSNGVRMIMDAIAQEKKIPLTEEFRKAVEKAAPMHDLGKIAINDAILRKPDKLTDEEFNAMKSHAAEGARIIHGILEKTDDELFKTVAENVAHYHHERWDGSGYPDGLKGEEIPLEARIMAIADVYDALVSERYYKGACSYKEANEIILAGMGTQFDPSLRSAFEKARAGFENYYSLLKEDEFIKKSIIEVITNTDWDTIDMDAINQDTTDLDTTDLDTTEI